MRFGWLVVVALLAGCTEAAPDPGEAEPYVPDVTGSGETTTPQNETEASAAWNGMLFVHPDGSLRMSEPNGTFTLPRSQWTWTWDIDTFANITGGRADLTFVIDMPAAHLGSSELDLCAVTRTWSIGFYHDRGDAGTSIGVCSANEPAGVLMAGAYQASFDLSIFGAFGPTAIEPGHSLRAGADAYVYTPGQVTITSAPDDRARMGFEID